MVKPKRARLFSSCSRRRREKVTVSKDGKTFAGSGIIKVLSGIDPFDPTATVLSTENISVSRSA
jgi:hypothetical protein